MALQFIRGMRAYEPPLSGLEIAIGGSEVLSGVVSEKWNQSELDGMTLSSPLPSIVVTYHENGPSAGLSAVGGV